jgi:hypothetical protein
MWRMDGEGWAMSCEADRHANCLLAVMRKIELWEQMVLTGGVYLYSNRVR